MARHFEIIDLALSLADEDTVIVPGHGSLGDRGALLEDDSIFEIFEQAGKLFAAEEGQFLVELLPVSETRFHLRGWIRHHFLLHSDASGAITGLTHQVDGGDSTDARKLSP